MATELIINATLPETRIALLEDGEIQDLLIERAGERGIAGNIYKGRVTRVLPGMQAAFVDIGLEKAAFLYVDDVHVHPEVFGPEVEEDGEGAEERQPEPPTPIESEGDSEPGPEPEGDEADPDGSASMSADPADEPLPEGTLESGSSAKMEPRRGSRTGRGGRRGGRRRPAPAEGTSPGTEEQAQVGEAGVGPGEGEPPMEAHTSGIDSPVAAVPHDSPEAASEPQARGPEARGMETGEKTVPAPEGRPEERVGRTRDRRLKPKAAKAPRQPVGIQDLLQPGQEVLVQVAKDPIATKGARLTCHISLPGRHLVAMPTISHVGVSRRIDRDDDRRRLREFVERHRPRGMGFIVRTASGKQNERRVKADIEYLAALWEDIKSQASTAQAPALVYEDLGAVLKVIRDWVNEDIDKIIVDSKYYYNEIQKFVSNFMPSLRQKVELYHGDIPIFDAYNLTTEIHRAMERKVWLKSGGYIVVDQAEALVAIDVNTGRYVGKKNLEDTILKTNLEAVHEIAYQLRLRNCGGIIILDFIDMEREENRTQVYRALEEALKRDRARPQILKISELGLVEMTRKRTRDTITRALCEPCNHCEGKGFVKSRPTVAYEILRAIEREGIRKDTGRVLVQSNPEVIDFLAIDECESLDLIEKRIKKAVELQAMEGFHPEQFEVSDPEQRKGQPTRMPRYEPRSFPQQIHRRERRPENRQEARNEGRHEGRHENRNEGRNDGRQDRHEGRNEGRNDDHRSRRRDGRRRDGGHGGEGRRGWNRDNVGRNEGSHLPPAAPPGAQPDFGGYPQGYAPMPDYPGQPPYPPMPAYPQPGGYGYPVPEAGAYPPQHPIPAMPGAWPSQPAPLDPMGYPMPPAGPTGEQPAMDPHFGQPTGNPSENAQDPGFQAPMGYRQEPNYAYPVPPSRSEPGPGPVHDEFMDEEDRNAYLKAQAAQDAALASLQNKESSTGFSQRRGGFPRSGQPRMGGMGGGGGQRRGERGGGRRGGGRGGRFRGRFGGGGGGDRPANMGQYDYGRAPMVAPRERSDRNPGEEQ